MARGLRLWDWFKNEDERVWDSPDAITPWHGSVPFQSLSQLRRDIDRMFEDAFHGISRRRQQDDRLPFANENLPLRPRVDIASTDKEYRVTLEVPGVEEKDIKLEMAGDMLIIRGEKRQEREEETRDMHCAECTYGAFERRLALPEDADPDNIDAYFKNGVLSIAMPRQQASKAPVRQIPIKHAA